MDLDAEKEKALNIALNKTGGDWDLPLLKDLLEELDTGTFDIEITGFDAKEIEALMTQYYIDHDNDADKSGASPWDRMSNSGTDGVMFNFGSVSCKIERSVYDKFYQSTPENNIAQWVTEVLLNALCDT